MSSWKPSLKRGVNFFHKTFRGNIRYTETVKGKKRTRIIQTILKSTIAHVQLMNLTNRGVFLFFTIMRASLNSMIKIMFVLKLKRIITPQR